MKCKKNKQAFFAKIKEKSQLLIDISYQSSLTLLSMNISLSTRVLLKIILTIYQ